MDALSSPHPERDPHTPPPRASDEAPPGTGSVVAEVIELTRRFAGACSLDYSHAAAIVATCLPRSASEEKSHPVELLSADADPNARLLTEVFRSVDTEEGRLRTFLYLTSGPYPRFHALPGIPGYFLRTESDGMQTIGKFVGRDFATVS